MPPLGLRRPRRSPALRWKTMGLLKSLADRARAKREDLQRRAAKKAAKVALDSTARAARGALDSIGDALEKAMFGEAAKPEADEADRAGAPEPPPPDPFAKLKAAEAERAARKRARGLSDEARDAEVDAELSAMKKRLGK
jgi:hypothetical protein